MERGGLSASSFFLPAEFLGFESGTLGRLASLRPSLLGFEGEVGNDEGCGGGIPLPLLTFIIGFIFLWFQWGRVELQRFPPPLFSP